MNQVSAISSIAVYEEGQKVMGRTKLGSTKLGKLHPGSPEDRRFRGFFGVSTHVVVDAWRLMEEHNLLPVKAELCHLLWALAFMCLYPKNDKALSRLLGNKDPKTINKYTTPFIESLFELDLYVVSSSCAVFNFALLAFLTVIFQSLS